MEERTVPIPTTYTIPPAYHGDLIEARRHLHIALDRMCKTPCATKEQFEKLVGIYSDLTDFMEEIEKGE